MGGILIEITLKTGGDFLKIKETLTRIGIPSKSEKKLYQSCHILYKNGKYYIAHFKELLSMEHGSCSIVSLDDQKRISVITKLLCDWNMCETVIPLEVVEEEIILYVISHKEKNEWELIQKYNFGGDGGKGK